MRRILLGVVITFASFLNVYGQSDSTTVNLLMTVANLRNDSLSSTGVFVQNKEGVIYLVTTAHIAKNMDKNVFVVIQGEERQLEFKITDFANPVNWQYHPTVDLAVLKLNPKPLFFNKYLASRFIPLDFIDGSHIPVQGNSLLTILGYKPGYRVSGYLPPMAYTSIVSNEKIIPEDPNLIIPPTLIALEKPSLTGYSGGPVFFLDDINQSGSLSNASKSIRMVGFIQGKIKDNAARTYSMMIPAYYLRDLIK